MKRLYFGTDGVRGPYGGPLINPDFAARLGEAAARWIGGEGKVLIGRDTRLSGPALVEAIAAGLIAGGLEAATLGVVPIPAVARAVRETDAILGVMITASHNPAGDNGIKFFRGDGTKLTDVNEAAIEALLPASAPPPLTAPLPQLANDYAATMSRVLPAGALAGWRIAVDASHGATCGTTPLVLRNFGAEVIGVANEPDGARINAGVGSEHPGLLARTVVEKNARLGIAHDGDGDRCVLCDETGSALDGDELLTILATHALEQGSLAKNELVITVQSNMGVDAAVRALGGQVFRTSVGDRYVIERMRLSGATLGGESSGHVICSDFSATGDGLIAALRTIEVMLKTGQSLSALRKRLKKFPQKTRALWVKDKRPMERLPLLQKEIDTLTNEFGEKGRVLVRFSGTEPKLRLLVEGESEAILDEAMARLERAARRELDVVDGGA